MEKQSRLNNDCYFLIDRWTIKMQINYEDSPWFFKGVIFTSDNIKKYFGFVYEIQDKETGQKYIGRKYFWSKKKVKGTTRRKRVESDWKTYFSSHDDLKKIGKECPNRLHRTILHLCSGQGETNFLEIEEQFKNDVLYSELYLNDQINRKVV